MKTFIVLAKFPSGRQIEIGVTPGDPLIFPNQENPPKSTEKRAILTMEDACEYVQGTCHNRLSPVRVEWPKEVVPVSERDQTAEDANAARAVLKALQDKPKSE